MVDTFIETYGTSSGGERHPKGDVDKAAWQALKENAEVYAVEHNIRNGSVVSTLFRVVNADQGDLDALTGAAPDHAEHAADAAQQRGLEIAPGTPTSAEVDDLATRVQNQAGVDLTAVQPSHTPSIHVYEDTPGDAVGGGAPAWAPDSPNPGAGGHNDAGNPPASDFATILKDDYPSIGQGNWRCVHPDHAAPEVVSTGQSCSLGHSNDPTVNDYVQQHREPFDVTAHL